MGGTNPTIDSVKAFWEASPLWTGESQFQPGTKSFYDEHRATVIGDCFAGKLDSRIFPKGQSKAVVLDLGCGPGFWTVELGKVGVGKLVAADLTNAAIQLAKKRCEIFGVEAEFRQENAEQLTFPDETFTHVNCQGVIHHSPNTPACVKEIARVLKPGGTASLSVYYKNLLLKSWPVLKTPAKFFAYAGAKLSGRGREKIYTIGDVNDLVRTFDGDANPIGKAYSREEFKAMVEPYFEIEETFLHFFPARSLPFPIPKVLHGAFDRHMGFLIYMSLRKR